MCLCLCAKGRRGQEKGEARDKGIRIEPCVGVRLGGMCAESSA